MHEEDGMNLEDTPRPLFRPGPRLGEEREHYDLAFRRIPGWCRSSPDGFAALWGRLQAGDHPVVPPGWKVNRVEDGLGLQEAPGTLSVAWMREPRELLLWRLPEPTFTTGVLWSAWLPGKGFYYTCEATGQEGHWMLGCSTGGGHFLEGAIPSGSLQDFLACVEDSQKAKAVPPATTFEGTPHAIRRIERILEIFRAQQAGDERRAQQLLLERFADFEES